MEEDKKLEKRKNLEIVVLSIIIVILLGALIYLLFIKKDKPAEPPKPHDNQQVVDNNSYSKIDESKDLYYYILGNTYEIYSNMENKKEKSHFQSISFNYPVINIETNSVVKLNNEIKKKYQDLEKKYQNFEENSNNGCICIKIDNRYYCGGEHIQSLDYGILETNDLITLRIEDNWLTECAGTVYLREFYTISKKTGEVLTNEELLKSINYNISNINDSFSKFLKEQGFVFDDIKLKYFIYNNELVIGYDFEETVYYKYDGGNFVEMESSEVDKLFHK